MSDSLYPVTPVLLTKQQLSLAINTPVRTIENWMAARIIPYFKVRHLVRFRLDDVIKALEANHLVKARPRQ